MSKLSEDEILDLEIRNDSQIEKIPMGQIYLQFNDWEEGIIPAIMPNGDL